jgi:ADP-heptose:LPS heptosyltransferase
MNLTEKFTNSRKIAIVRTDKIGDVVLTLPLVRALKLYNPGFQITFIANSYTESLLKNEFIDSYFFVDKFENGIDDIFKNNQFDTCFFPMPKYNEVFSAFKNRIPLRIGSAYRLYSILFNFKIKEHRKISKFHEAEYNVRMLNSITNSENPVLPVKPNITNKDINSVSDILNSLNYSKNQKIIIIHPGSGGSSKDLPVKKLVNLINSLINQNQYVICITGTKNEAEVCNYLESSCKNSINLCDKLKLDEMIALISISSLLIANSTGVLHIASSLGISVLGFYPNTPHLSQKRWGPLWTNSICLSPPNLIENLYNDDMNTIDEDEIIKSVVKLLSN